LESYSYWLGGCSIPGVGTSHHISLFVALFIACLSGKCEI
jgi:hypothetical protein